MRHGIRPRILLLTADYAPGNWSGIGVAVEQQARSLAGLGVEVHVLRRGEAPRISRNPHIHSLSGSSFPIDASGFDAIHLHSLSLSELALELRRRTGIRLVYTVHSLVAFELGLETPEDRFWSLLQTEVMRASDAVVFLSESERASGLSLVPEIASRSRVVGNGLPPSPPPGRRRPDGPVVFAGRFAVSKGVELLEALLPLMRNRWSGRFVLAGGHGDEPSLRAIARLRSNLGESLEVTEWLPRQKLDQLFATASVMLVPSRYEPFGLVALEAMRMGAPVLAACVGGLVETVASGSGGQMVASRDPQEWCDAALSLLGDQALRKSLEQLGPAFVAERFDCMNIAHRLLREVYCVSI